MILSRLCCVRGFAFFTASVFALGLAASNAFAVEPALGDIAPYGIQRGVETEVLFTGGRLADAQQLLLYSPGITVTSLEVVNDGTVKTKLNVAADCRLGIHAVRVRSATGVSNLRTFSVGALPEIKEVEPNSEFTAPQPVPLGCVINGIVQSEDVDHFVVEAKKGERITAELEGLRLGNSFFDPYLAILNSARFELARSDDVALLNQDCLCAIVAPADGKYIIQVRESAYGGDGNCKYRIHVGKFPRPTAVIPAGGKPGETLDVKWIGDAGGEFVTKVTLPTSGVSEFGLYAQDAQGISPSPNMVRISDLPNVIEAEPNDALAQATPGVAPSAMNGVIEKPGDVDHFKFNAKAGTQYDIRVYARGTLRSPLDSVLTILNSKGAGVVGNDDSAGPDSYLRFAAPADDDYVVQVQDHLKSGGPNYAYRVEITPVKASLTMVLPEKQQYVPTTLAVPRGNRMALMVAASRANFGGDLVMDFKDLPAGLTFQTETMTANRSEVPVLFSAAPEAAPAGSLVDFVGRTADEKLGIVGHLNQRTMLIRGQNNIDVWGHNADRMAVVLTQDSPFKIDIVQPKAPLVRNGEMNLKVVATRANGFVAPINIRLLYNPPGIASSGSVAIPQGANEATIPVTANSGAEIKVWPLIVLASAPVANGTVEVASQMATLDVADVFFTHAIQKAAVEQGKETEVVVKVEKKKDFEGNAKIELLGLPAGATTIPLEANKDTAELVFKVKTEAAARPGKYGSLVCRTTFLAAGEPVVHTLGPGELRIDAPLPPKVDAPKPAPMPMPAPVAAPAAPAKPPEKRLTRLEQLRLDREKEKEGKK